MNEVAYIALLMGGTPALMESIKLKKYLDREQLELKKSSLSRLVKIFLELN